MKISIDQACPFCGQFVAIHIDDDTPMQDREAMAKAKCGCPQAVRERDIREAMDKMEQVCGITSLDNGFDEAVDDETMEVCRKVVAWVYDMAIREATIQSLHGDKIVIKNGHKCVKIKRTCRKELAL